MKYTDLKIGTINKKKDGIVIVYQESLMKLGFPLVKWGADGQVGNETVKASAAYAMAKATDLLSLSEIDDMEEVIPAKLVQRVIENGMNSTEITVDVEYETESGKIHVAHQLSSYANNQLNDVEDFPLLVDGTHLVDKQKYAKNPNNNIKDIDTICLHQMACEDGRDNIESYQRWKNLAIHAVVTSGVNSRGVIFQPLTRRMAHGHKWNGRSVGIEFEGHYAGTLLKDGKPDMRNYWRPSGSTRVPMRLSKEAVEAGLQLIEYLVKEVAELGGQIRYIAAHRQSYSTKASDPGQEIWSQVAVVAMKRFGLMQAPTLAAGSPIPEAWDSSNVGVKYR